MRGARIAAFSIRLWLWPNGMEWDKYLLSSFLFLHRRIPKREGEKKKVDLFTAKDKERTTKLLTD